MLSPSLPIPGPITIASGDLPESTNDDNVPTDSRVRNSLSGRISGIRLGGHLVLLDACSGIATWTRSHPLLAAAIPDRMGAPWYGPPPTTSNLPLSPLLASESIGGYLLASPTPQFLTSAGHGRSEITISPHPDSDIPIFGEWNVTVRIGCRESGPPKPVGMSQEITGNPVEVAQLVTSMMGDLSSVPSAGPPAPRRQSTIRVQSPSGISGQTWIGNSLAAISLARDEIIVFDDS